MEFSYVLYRVTKEMEFSYVLYRVTKELDLPLSEKGFISLGFNFTFQISSNWCSRKVTVDEILLGSDN